MIVYCRMDEQKLKIRRLEVTVKKLEDSIQEIYRRLKLRGLDIYP